LAFVGILEICKLVVGWVAMVIILHCMLQDFRLFFLPSLKGKRKENKCLGEKSERNIEFGGRKLIRCSGRWMKNLGQWGDSGRRRKSLGHRKNKEEISFIKLRNGPWIPLFIYQC
jgi:hypothetical protein